MSKDDLPRAAELSEKAKGKRPMVSKQLATGVTCNNPSASSMGPVMTPANRRGAIIDSLLDLSVSSDTPTVPDTEPTSANVLPDSVPIGTGMYPCTLHVILVLDRD